MSPVQINIDGHDQPERICTCGCKRSLEGMRRNAIYATSACRGRDWKRREGYADPRRRKASRNGKSGRSGLQVSYAKALAAAMRSVTYARLSQGTPARAIAERHMSDALSPRQRTRLEQRRQEAA